MTSDWSRRRWIVSPFDAHDRLAGASNISAGTKGTTPLPFVARPAADATRHTSGRVAKNKRNAAADIVRAAGSSSASTPG
jgi:hypothetical protein